MWRFLLYFLLVAPLHGQMLQTIIAGGSNCVGINGFSCRETITFNGYAGGSTLSNFDAYIDGDTGLATTANGGYVTNASGFDVVFTSDSGCATPLSWETQVWSGTNGNAAYKVKIASLAGTTTVIYRCIGKASVTTFQGGAVGGAYDSAYKMVQGFPNGTSVTGTDSSSNANNLTLTNWTATAGKVDGAGSLNGTTATASATPTGMATPTGLTLSAWINPTDYSTSPTFRRILVKGEQSGTPFDEYAFSVGSVGEIRFEINNGTIRFFDTTTHVSTGTFSFVTCTWDGTTMRTYINGTLDATNLAMSGSVTATTTALAVGYSTVNAARYFHGIIDELSMANVARSSDWIAAQYKNTNTPGSFYTVSK